jgi:hypothetical protein
MGTAEHRRSGSIKGFVGKYYAIDKEKLVQWSISSSRLNWKE